MINDRINSLFLESCVFPCNVDRDVSGSTMSLPNLVEFSELSVGRSRRDPEPRSRKRVFLK